jgi:hypothetical protein
VTLCDRCE